VTDLQANGASVVPFDVEVTLDGVNWGVDLSADCTAPAGGSNNCGDPTPPATNTTAIGPYTNPTLLRARVSFDLSAGDTVTFSGRADIFPAAIPEPGSIVMMASGFVGLVLLARRRRSA